MLNDPVILVASDNKSTNEIIQSQLSTFTGLLVPEDLDALLLAYERHQPQIIILAYDSLDRCEQVYDRLYPREMDQNPARKPHRVIALCNKHEVGRAYDLCSCDRFTDYIVFWPLTYDPMRLAMSVHQSITDLQHNHNAQENDRLQMRQLQNIGQLREAFEQHDEQGRSYGGQIETRLSGMVDLLRETLNHYDHLVNRVLDQTTACLSELSTRQTLASIREGLEHSVSEVRDAQRQSHQFIDALDRIRQEFSSVAPRHQSDRKHILVVDDDDFQRQVLSTILGSEGYSLGLASSGEAALESVQLRRPDLILMDILMPGMSGLEATTRIKASPAMAPVPIIIISGQNQREIVLECISKGATDYIVKPYNKATLVSKIEEALAPKPE